MVAVKFPGLNSEGWSEFQVELTLSDTDILAILNRNAHHIRGAVVVVNHEKGLGSIEQGRNYCETCRS